MILTEKVLGPKLNSYGEVQGQEEINTERDVTKMVLIGKEVVPKLNS